MNLDAELLEKRNRGGVEDCVDRVQAQTVDAIVAQPHQCVVAKESADLVAVPIVEINRVAPWRVIPVSKVGTEFREIVPFRTEVIVNDVENNGEAVPMRRIDETLHRVGTAV